MPKKMWTKIFICNILSSVNSVIKSEALHMKYFLKRTMLKKGEYLQIYISEYRRDVGLRNRLFKALSYVEELKEGGIKDPVA